jgi:hypothetical protein
MLIGVLNANDSPFIGGTQAHLKALRESLGRADAILDGIATTTNPLKVFIAPEYFFSQKVEMPRRVGDGTKTGYMPVSRAQYEGLLEELLALSRQHPDFLIVAGSIHYMEGAGEKTTYNVCPVIAGGVTVHLYHKKAYDHFAADVLTNPAFSSGSESPMFDFADLRFGLEICLDHGKRVLSSHLASSGSAAPDIQVLVSRGMRLGRLSATQLAIHCDMSPGVPNAGTVKRADGTVIDCLVASRRIFDGTYVEGFRVGPNGGATAAAGPASLVARTQAQLGRR